MRAVLLIVLFSTGGAGICCVVAGARGGSVNMLGAGLVAGTVAGRVAGTVAGRVAGPGALTHRASRLGHRRARRGAIAVIAGLVAYAVTGWPVTIPFATFAVLGRHGLGGRSTAVAIARLEAIATWTEMLRDTLAGAAGLTQALIATAPICPAAIREEVSTLAAGLANGVALTTALRSFGEEAADPATDVVVASLLMAATESAQRLGELLGALAESTREEITMRQAVEASRSSARSAVRTVTGFSFGFLGFMALFARSYLAPYHSADGQLALTVVGALFGLGLWLMAVMVRPKPAPRLFAAGPTS